MRTVVADVATFMVACDQPVRSVPQIPPQQEINLRLRLVDEEVNRELLPAIRHQDLPMIADAIADSIYVIVGTALSFGIPLEQVWSIVQASNMAKVQADGMVLKDEHGKVVKPDGWVKPDAAIAALIANAQL